MAQIFSSSSYYILIKWETSLTLKPIITDYSQDTHTGHPMSKMVIYFSTIIQSM